MYVVTCLILLFKMLTDSWKELGHVSTIRHSYLLQKKHAAKSVFLLQ